MYNDYYLQQIDNKLNISNNNLNEIIENQEIIIEQNQTLISGDREIITNQQILYNGIGIEILIITIILIYHFIERCLK